VAAQTTISTFLGGKFRGLVITKLPDWSIFPLSLYGCVIFF